MSPRFLRLALTVALATLFVGTTAWAVPDLSQPHLPDQVIIKFKTNASQQDKDLILSDLDASQIKHLGRIKSDLKRLGSISVEEAISRYQNHPKIEFIEPNYIVTANEEPNDPRFDELWGMQNTGQTGGTAGADISATMAWDVFTGNPDIVVGIIDTGVDYNHQDLASNIWTNPGEIPGNGIDDDANGYIDDIHGWDFVNDDGDPMDDNGHGTHCAGTIGGVGNNGLGVAGVNWTVKIMALKFLSSGGSGSTADAVDAIEYATMMALRYPGTIRLTSNSWGGGGFSEAMRQAIEDAGNAEMLFVAAAGNSSSNTDVSPHYPSAYAEPNVIAVAATDHNDQLASFSSYGATSVDLAAPGVSILSTIPGNGYALLSGTSMATPHVSGVAALTFGRFPAISALDAKSLILGGVDVLPNLDGVVLTGGRLNAFWPIAEPDSIVPDPVTDLTVTEAGSNWLNVQWTATGDDGSIGDASRYDMRYSLAPITDLNWDSATMVAGEPDPGPPGTLESMRIPGLDFDTTYWVAVKVLDEFGNPSDVSNSPSGTTLGIPDIASTPSSMSEALLTGATSSQMLTLSNVGFGTLDFEIPTPTLLGEPVLAADYVQFPKGVVDTRPGQPAIDGSGGPDAFGYRWVDSNDPFGPAFAWSDISGVGSVALSTGDDVNDGPYPIGFSFPFYGADFTEFRVASNGFMSLSSSSSDYSNQPLPSAGAPGHLIAPFWDDLDVASGTVYYYNDGSRLIVQWDAVLHYGSGGPYTFQALLYPDGTIEYQYLSMGAPTNSATVGWQNGTGTDGGTIVYNSDYVADNLAIQIRAVPQWVTVTPTAGTIYAPNSTMLTVDFDATGLIGGTYTGEIRVLSNDPDEPEFIVPVQLDVTGAPDVAVEPASWDYGALFLGAVGEKDFVIRNVGTDVLTISDISIDDATFGFASALPTTIGPKSSAVVTVNFTPAVAQAYSGTMTVNSDDPDEPTIEVNLSGSGLVPPEFALDPTSLTSNLLTGGNETQYLTLSNSGGADFEWDMAINFDANVTVYDTPDIAKGEVDANPGILGAGGPDNFGYSWIDSDEPGGPVFDWVDITAVGTPVYGGNADDSNQGPFPIGFDFPFYGDSFPTFRVSSNGFITFTSTSSDLSNAPLPGTGAPENLLAVLHDDMYVDADIPSQVFYHNDGQRLIVQFHNIRRYGQSDQSPPFYDMQAILYPSGTIIYQYLTVEAGGNSGATIGIQNATRDDGLTVVYNADYVHDGLAIRFESFPEWLTVTPTSGVIPPGGSTQVAAQFNASGMFGGTYTADIHLETNDPSVPTLDVPVTLNVTGAPQIVVNTTSIDFGSQFIGFPTVQNLIISNIGTDQLILNGWSLNSPVFGTNLAVPTFLGPTQSVLIDMTFLPTVPGEVNALFTIASNDPAQPNVVVNMTGTGLIAPVASASPTSLSSDLFTGETETQQVLLTNSGGSDLEFSIGAQLSATSVMVHESPDMDKAEVDRRPGILGSGGPDMFGYSWSDSDEPGGPTFNWVDISATGTPVFTSTGDDRNFGPFPIGFSFPFYGNDFSEFRVCSNGWVSFTNTTTDLSNDPLPASGAPENLLAAFWDDLVVDLSVGGNVYYEYDGSRTIIQYDGVRRYGSSNRYTFQIILRPNGAILYQYLTMEGTRLDEATIGIQNATKDDGLTVVFNDAYVHDNMAVRLSTVPEWLSSNPSSGVVPPGGSLPINVTFDATGLFGGAYDGAVLIGTNDPAHGQITIPAHLDVTGIPLMAVDPASLDFGNVYLTQSNTLQLTVSNPGSQTLEVTGIVSDDPQCTPDLAAFTVEPLQSQVVNVTFLAATAGTMQGALTITHNAVSSPDEVPMTATGVVSPEIVVTPTSLEAAAMPGGQKVKTVTICNEGGSDLNFSIAEAQDATGVQIYQELTLAKQVDEAGSVEAVDPRPSILGTGGPDLFGYTWTDSDEPGGPAFDWVDISGVGTPVPFPSYADDGNVGPVPIGFDFPFYDGTFSELYACSNGWMSFTNSTLRSYSNQPLPNSGSSVPENLLAPWWDDMVYDESDGNSAYYYNDGSRFIIQYDVRRIAAFTPPFYEFQVILYPNGNIVYQYNTLGTNLSSSTIGIQNGTKDDGLTVVHNDGSYIHEGMAILFSAAPDWMAVDPASGVIPAGECMDVTVTLDASALEAGDYTGNITITSNDVTDPIVDVPVLFHVGTVDAAYSEADPNTLNVSSNGKFITVYVELPPEYDPMDVVLETVMLNGVVPAETSPFSNDGDFNGNGIPDLMFKFDRTAVAAILPEGADVELVVTGEIEDTIYFVATDMIRVINPTMMYPNGGEAIAVGGTQSISWANPEGWNVDHADLFFSPDDGETWVEIARNVEGTSYVWTFPTEPTDQARIRVFVYDNKGILGFDSSNELFELSAQITGVTPSSLPKTYALSQNAPNPFNPRTVIKYDLPNDEQVRISVFDVKGRLVKTLVTEFKTAGTHETIWDGVDNRGVRVSSGVYYYQIQAGKFTATKSMVLMK